MEASCATYYYYFLYAQAFKLESVVKEGGKKSVGVLSTIM